MNLGDNGWRSCPDGVLSSIAAAQRRERRRRFLSTSLRVIAIVAAPAATGGWWLWTRLDRDAEGSTSADCERVAPLIPSYAAGTLGASEFREVEAHLVRCAPCAAIAAQLVARDSSDA